MQTDALNSSLISVSERLAVIEKDLNRLNTQKEQKPTSWWTIVTGVLGIPALIILMYLQFTDASLNLADEQKSQAETSKFNTEELKARAELEMALNQLRQQSGSVPPQNLDRIEELTSRIEEIVRATKVSAEGAMVANAVTAILDILFCGERS